jgi:hypothetical protein
MSQIVCDETQRVRMMKQTGSIEDHAGEFSFLALDVYVPA